MSKLSEYQEGEEVPILSYQIYNWRHTLSHGNFTLSYTLKKNCAIVALKNNGKLCHENTVGLGWIQFIDIEVNQDCSPIKIPHKNLNHWLGVSQ
jgi:hypothetical protein